MAGKANNKKTLLSSLISTTKLLNYPKIKQLSDEFPKHFVKEIAKSELQKVRDTILAIPEEKTGDIDISPERLEIMVDIRVRSEFRPSVRPAINAAGIILHTALGRAPLAEEAQKEVADAIKNYCTLAIDVPTGKRGNRYKHVEDLLIYLTGAEAACIVNNNAGAVLLVLNTLAEGKEVVISRGQLVEIGGAFRIPDVMSRSGAVMVEVGTTNRTHLRDYENAFTEETSMVQHVHHSNYKITGFTGEVPIDELKPLCKKHDLPLVEDIGSGCLIDLTQFGLPYEPLVQDSIRAGADVVTFSGDKMLGGPQSGIIVGNKQYIDMIKKNPLCRAMRNDKLTYAALEATLKLYLDRNTLMEKLPVFKFLSLSPDILARRARNFIRKLKPLAGDNYEFKVIDSGTQMGSGSLPEKYIPTKAVAIKSKKMSPDELGTQLRLSDPPVFARIENDQVLLDFRTVDPKEIPILVEVLANID
ncbi:MAG: L-seryl-tRNA(Sec) selenium transferase [bacterium]|nr:L-seryl-tRNA(Sec) selenium transferase [bacterium]